MDAVIFGAVFGIIVTAICYLVKIDRDLQKVRKELSDLRQQIQVKSITEKI
ncbi:hypothetical protein [Erysipelothrix aquatica]|uniref:hypothetical protein n=1 Tax=Erysipelothrix aquatica TaxID=2683714 RepID=UPI00135854A1|nr:hypothetical protein [Erysipelothrix aquatica]